MKAASQDLLISKGLDLDTHESLLQPNALAFLLNGDISGYENSGNDTFVQNVLSNELCLRHPLGYTLLGAIPISRGQFALFYKTENSSEIGIFDSNTCAYISKINNACLGFESEIKGVFKTLSGCDSRRIFWVEKDKPIRLIDIDECLPTKDISDCFDCEKELVFDCDAFNLNKCIKFPDISLKEGIGNLPNGNYQIAMALTDDEVRFTEYYVYPEVIKFHTNNQANNRFGIEIEFTSCPQGFDQYELVLISHRTDRGTLAQRVGYFDVEQTTFFISELDDTSYTPIDLIVLGETFPYYQSAAGIAQNDEQLLLNGVVYREIPNYQPIANKISSKWVEYKVKAKDAAKYKSFMRGETYAFTINGVYCDGERTPEYHIPSDAEAKIKGKSNGLITFSNLFHPVTNADACESTDPCEVGPVLNWQVYDSSSITSGGEDPFEAEYCTVILMGERTPVADFCYALDPPESFIRRDNFFSITVKNKYCEPTESSLDIIVSVQFKTTDCLGAVDIYDLVFTLPAGQSVFQYVFPAETLVDCAHQCLQETTEILSYTVLSNHLQECPEGDWCETRPSPCDGNVSKMGDFGYWESTLHYPNNPCIWGQREDPEAEFYDPYGLSCQPVKYHRFPDNKTTHIHDNASCGSDEFINILAVEFSNIRPFLDKNGDPIKGISGYEINVVDRANHKSILHKGLIYNMFEEKLADCTTSYYANYPFNDLNPDIFLSKTPAQHSLNGVFDILLDAAPFVEFNYNPVNTYSKSRFEYISPDVSYERNDAGQYIQLYSEENGPIEGKFSYTDEMPTVNVVSDIAYNLALLILIAGMLIVSVGAGISAGQATLTALVENLNPVQYCINYWAKTQYRSNNFYNIIAGNIRRKINIAQYTLPTKMLIGNNKVNNFQRESGLFIELCSDILNPFVKERSRIRYSDNLCKPEFSFCEMTNFAEQPETASYYAGIKVARPNQYNMPGSTLTRTITNVNQWNNLTTVSSGVIFGGDIFITKHKHIRKFPFFTSLPLNTPPRTEYLTRPYMNVWHSRYWFNPANASSVAALFPFAITSQLAFSYNNDRNLEKTGTLTKVNCDNDIDCRVDNILRVDGTFYTHVVGEIEYWCESEYIGGFREFNEIPESDIERSQNEKIKYRTIQYPELYLYNRQYHWKGFSPFTTQADIDFDCCNTNQLCATNTLAYSLKHDPLRRGDAWTKFLPNNIQQFSSKDGNLIGVREIDDTNILFFFEDAVYITQRDESLEAKGSTIFLGAPDAFSRRLRKISDDASGFGGCVDLNSVIPTRYGVFWFDRKRKKFIHFSDRISDATGKIQSWLNENLIGEVFGVYDNFTDNIYYTGKGANGCNWTLSFKPLQFLSTQDKNGWVGFHSFTPDIMLPMYNNFLTGNEVGLWKHNKLYDYQRYYDQVYPFEVGTVLKSGGKPIIPQHFEVYSEWVKYDDFGKKRYDTKVFFDKIMTYNQLRTTGKKNLFLKDINNENHHGFQNSTNLVEVTQVEDFIYRINKFAVESTYQPSTCLTCMEVDSTEVLNVEDPTLEQMRGKWFKTHLINEKPEYKVLLQMLIGNNEEIKH